MNISINKDFDKEYKNDSWRGFSMQETVCIGMAFFSAVLTGGWMYYSFHIPLNAVLYAGLFPAAPFLAFGFYRYQGMNLFELGKELLEEKKVSCLSYEAGEYEEIPVEREDRKKDKREKKQEEARKRNHRRKLQERRKRWA